MPWISIFTIGHQILTKSQTDEARGASENKKSGYIVIRADIERYYFWANVTWEEL